MYEEQETQSLASRSFQPAWGDQGSVQRAHDVSTPGVVGSLMFILS